MTFVYTGHKPGDKLETEEVASLDEAAALWHTLGRPECWLFPVVGQAPWHCAAETVQISRQRGKVSS